MPNRDVMRTSYLDALLETYGTLRLPVGAGEEFLPLQAVFQPLQLRSGAFSFENGPEQREDAKMARNGSEALAKSRRGRMVVLGGPGMGKTTLLKALLQQAIQEARNDLGAPLPLFLSLPDLARSGLTLPAYLPQILAQLEIDASYASTLVEAIEQGRAFLCLDSLDEVIPAQRPDLIAQVDREAARCGGTWIIGSRFTEYKGGQFIQGQFTEWELQPLDEEMRLELARHLLPLIASLLQQEPAPSAQGFVTALDEDTRIAEWGTNPLLISLAAIVYTQAGMLPGCRAALYREIVDIMLAGRAPQESKRVELRALLAETALQLYQTRGRNFTTADLFELLNTYLPDVTYQKRSAMFARILDSGLLDVVAHQTYGFKHQMFQEYLAAVALAAQLTSPDEDQYSAAWDFAWHKHTYSRWREILRLCVGVLVQEHSEIGQQIATRWLRRLAAERDTPDGDIGNLCLELALGSLREFSSSLATSELAEIAQQLVLVWAELLINEGAKRTDHYLEIYHGRISALVEYVELLDLPVVLPALRWLEHISNAGYNNIDRYTLHNIMTEWWFYDHKLNIPPKVLTQAYPHAQGISFSACTLPATLQTYASQEQVIRLLLDEDENPSVRAHATILLGGWEARTPLSVLYEVLENTRNHHEIRVAAADTLSQQADALSIERLVPLLQDKNIHVRHAVVQALARTGPRLPIEPLFALLNPARIQENQDIYKTILEAFGRLNEPAKINLKPLWRALKDENPENTFQRAGAIYLLGSRISSNQLFSIMHSNTFSAIHYAALHVARKSNLFIPPDTLLANLVCQESPHYVYDHFDLFNQMLETLRESDRVISGKKLGEFARRTDETLEHAIFLAWELQITLPVDILLTALREYEYKWRIAEYAAQMLAKLGNEAPIASLLAILQDPTSPARAGAARTFSLLPTFAALEHEPLIHLLQNMKDSPNTAHRSQNPAYNLLVLGLVRDQASIPMEFLLNALLARWSPNDEEKENDDIILAIAKSGEGVPLEKLLAMIPDHIDPYYGLTSEDRILQTLRYTYHTITPEILLATALQSAEDQYVALYVLKAMGQQAPIDLLKSILDDQSRDRVFRFETRVALQQIGVQLPLNYLLADAGWNYSSTDYATLASIRKMGSKAPIEELLAILRLEYRKDSEQASSEWQDDEKDWVHTTAIDALRELAAYVPAEPVSAALEHNHPWVRAGAARVLAAFGERAPVDKLISIACNPNEIDNVRRSAYEALAELHAYTSPEPLIALLNDPNLKKLFRIEEDFYCLLTKWGRDLPLEPLLAAINSKLPGQRGEAIAVLGWLEDRVPLGFLLALLDSENENDAEHAARALVCMGTHAPLDVLRAHIYDANGEMRANMIGIVGELGENAPLDLILQALDIKDRHMHHEAKRSINNLAKTMPRKFLEATKDDPRSPVREARMVAIAHMGENAPLDLALAALNDEDMEVRLEARQTLIKLKIDPSLLPLEPFLLDLRREDIWIQHMFALQLLAGMGSRVPAEPLLALLGARDRRTCEEAAQTLYKTHPEAFAEVARQAEAMLRGGPTGDVFASRVQSRVAQRVKEIGRATPAVLEMVTDLLDWPYWEVRVSAAEALGAVQRNIPDRALRRLMELRHDPEARAVREAADQALAEILSRESGVEDE